MKKGKAGLGKCIRREFSWYNYSNNNSSTFEKILYTRHYVLLFKYDCISDFHTPVSLMQEQRECSLQIPAGGRGGKTKEPIEMVRLLGVLEF